MKLVSWNVNGLRAVLKKGFYQSFEALGADVMCLQETKMQQGQCELELPGYHQYFSYADRKGYSGTAVLTRREPVSIQYGLGLDEHDHEGRTITCEFDSFFLVCCYTPNSQNELRRLDYRMRWEDDFRRCLQTLDAQKPVILCGDLNVAHREIDLKNPSTNHHNAGFTDEERAKMDLLLNSGFIDTFRYFHPDLAGAYTWWSYIGRARERNAGWRIDYFIASERLRDRLCAASIHPDIMGSDHCPVSLEIQDA